MTKAHHLQPRRSDADTKPMPLNFLLGCSQDALGNFELARLADVANLRAELHAILDRVIDAMSQAALASWFKNQDRNSLKHAIENEETPEEWAKRMIRDGQRSEEEKADYLLPMPSPNLFRPSLPPGAAHLAASLRYGQRNLAEGKCEKCPEPLDCNSVRYCTKHLAWKREQDRKDREKKGVRIGTHGREPGRLVNLAMNREKKTRALLAELGIKPEHAAVSLNAAKEALLANMPDKAHAMTQTELFEKAGVITRTTGEKALKALLASGQIQRIGAGGVREPYRYFLTE